MTLLVLLAACTPAPEEVPEASLAPDIQVTPTSVVLSGRLSDDAATETVTVANRGFAALEIRDIAWVDPAPAFFVSNIGAILVPPGSSTTFAISWDPTEVPDVGTLLITSNDPDTPIVELAVSTLLEPEGLVVTPESLSFGVVPVGCSSTQEVTLDNRGLVDVTVLEWTSASDTDELTLAPDAAETPFVVPAGESRAVSVVYQPADDTADVGYLEIQTDETLRPSHVVSQAGNGGYGEWHTDRYTRPEPMPMDVLFVIDSSDTSEDDQARLQAAFPTFLAALEGQDYAIGVMGMEGALLRGELLLPDTEDPLGELAGLMPGSGAYGYHLGLQNLHTSVTMGDALDMRREEGLFTILFISDAADESPEPWEAYWEALDTFGPHPRDTIFHAISGDTMGGCGESWPENAAYELTVASGGAYLGLCDVDWTDHMTRLATLATPDPSRFVLSGVPLVASIEVTTDGRATTSGWSYDAATNAVVFEEGEVPSGGSVVELQYAPVPECE